MKKVEKISPEDNHWKWWLRMKGYTLFSMLVCLILFGTSFINFEEEKWQFLTMYGLTVFALYLYLLGRKNKALLEDLESKFPWQ